MTRKKRSGRRAPLSIAALVVPAFILGILFAVFFFRFTGIMGEKPPSGETRTVSIKPIPSEPVKPPKLPLPPPPLKKVAIVIDDMGYGMKKLRELLEVDAPITVAVLPHLKNSREVAIEAYENGREVILHLPMEPRDTGNYDPGEGALLTTMAEDEVVRVLKTAIEGVPFLSGVNNHMGSKFTEDEELMRVVLEVVKESGIYFLDSKTTEASVAGTVAKELGVKTASRNIFLDNRRDEEYIRGQFAELIAVARKNGRAVAIGHPYPETIAVLTELVPHLKDQGVEVVALSELVE